MVFLNATARRRSLWAGWCRQFRLTLCFQGGRGDYGATTFTVKAAEVGLPVSGVPTTVTR